MAAKTEVVRSNSPMTQVLSTDDVDRLWEVFRPIADHLGFDFEWYRESDQMLSFTFTRRPS